MNGLLQQLGGRINVEVLDMDRGTERDDAQRRFNQTRYPSYVFLDANGAVVKRLIGEQPESVLREAMAEIAAAAQ